MNLDDVLRDLGEPNPDAPTEPDVSPPVEQAPGGLVDDSAAGIMVSRNDAPSHASPDEGALSVVFNPGLVRSGPTLDLGQTLLRDDVIAPDELANAVRVMKETPGKSLVDTLIEMGIEESKVQACMAAVSGLPFESFDPEDDDSVDQRGLKRLTLDYCKANLVIPLRREGSRMVVGTCRPDDIFVLDEVRRKLGVASIKHVLVTSSDILGVVEHNTEEEAEEYDVDDILADVDEDDVELMKDDKDDDDFEAEAESSPVVRYVNHIIQTALKEGASDIHIEPGEKKLKVRFRIDGVLFEMMNPPHRMHSALTSRIKIMANLDIAERRMPQDGRIRATVLGRKLDLRVSTLPTAQGEKTVMRILDNRSIQVSLDELGFEEDTCTIWKNQIDQPHGIILVTGPTGSGKTTTLYSSLRQMDTHRKNVSTVEDPVEYALGGITQTQTHDKIGMTFGMVLKALLRQDPDVVMVGEIRDMETATIAIQAALTGHLVLSTLHTNDAPSSVTRLINIGVESFMIGAALNSVLAQRLVRRICPACKVMEPVSSELEDILAMHGVHTNELPVGKGCNKCRETGYAGRLGLYEMLLLDDFLRDAIARSPNVTEFRRTCTERGMVTLREDGFRKVADGMTTVAEVMRVTESTI